MIPGCRSFYFFSLLLLFSLVTGLPAVAQESPEITEMEIAGEEVDPDGTTQFRVFEDDLDEFNGQLPVTGTVDPRGYEGDFIVEVTTDGGETWEKAEGTRNFEYRFRPFRRQTLEIAARVVTDYWGGDALLRVTNLQVEGPDGDQVVPEPGSMLDPGNYQVRMRVENIGDEPAQQLSLTARMEGEGQVGEWSLNDEGQGGFGNEIAAGESGQLTWNLSIPNPDRETSLQIMMRRGDNNLADLSFRVRHEERLNALSHLEVTRFQVKREGDDPTSIPYTELLEPGSYELIIELYNGSDQQVNFAGADAINLVDVRAEVLDRGGSGGSGESLLPDESFFSGGSLSPGDERVGRTEFTIDGEDVNRMARFEVLFNGDPFEQGSIPIVPVYAPGEGVSIRKFTLRELSQVEHSTQEVRANEGTRPPVYEVFPGRIYYGILTLYNRTDEVKNNVPVQVTRNGETRTYRTDLIRPGTTGQIIIQMGPAASTIYGKVRMEVGWEGTEDRSSLIVKLVRPIFQIPELPEDMFSLESPMEVTVPDTKLTFRVEPGENATRNKFYGQAQLVYKRHGRKQYYPRQPVQFGTEEVHFEINDDNVLTGISRSEEDGEDGENGEAGEEPEVPGEDAGSPVSEDDSDSGGGNHEIAVSFGNELLVKDFIRARFDTLTLRASGEESFERELTGTLDATFFEETEFIAPDLRRPLVMQARTRSGNVRIGQLTVTDAFWFDLSTIASPPSPNVGTAVAMNYLPASMQGLMVYEQQTTFSGSSPHFPDWFKEYLSSGDVNCVMNLLLTQEGVRGGIRFDANIELGDGYELSLEDAAAPLQAPGNQFFRSPEMNLVPHIILDQGTLQAPQWLVNLGFPESLSFDASGTTWGRGSGQEQNLQIDNILSGANPGTVEFQLDEGGGTPLSIGLDGEAQLELKLHSHTIPTRGGRQSFDPTSYQPVAKNFFGSPFQLIAHAPEIGFGNSTARMEQLKFSDRLAGSIGFSTHWVLPESSAYRIGLEGIVVKFKAGETVETSITSSEPGGSLIKFMNAEVTSLGFMSLSPNTITLFGNTYSISSSGSSGKTIQIPAISQHWDTENNEFEDFTLEINRDFAFDTDFDGAAVRIQTIGGIIIDYSEQESHIEDATDGQASRGILLPEGNIKGPEFMGGSLIDIVDFYVTQSGFGGRVQKEDFELTLLPGITVSADSIGVGFRDGGYEESTIQGGQVTFSPPVTQQGEDIQVNLTDAAYKPGENGAMDFYAEGNFESGQLNLPGDFALNNLSNFLLDFSGDLPESDPNWAGDVSLQSWRGVYFASGSLQMPVEHEDGDTLNIGWDDLQLDEQGVTGTFSPRNTLSVQSPFQIQGLSMEIEDSSSLTFEDFALSEGNLEGSVTYSFGGSNGEDRTIGAENFTLEVENQQVGFLCEQFQLPENFQKVSFGQWDISVNEIGIDLSNFSNLNDMPDQGYGEDYRGLLMSGGLNWEKKVNIGENKNKKKTFKFQADNLTIPFSQHTLSGTFSFNDQAERLKFTLPWGNDGYIWFREGELVIAQSQFEEATLDGELRVPAIKKQGPGQGQDTSTGGGEGDDLIQEDPNLMDVINRIQQSTQLERYRQYIQNLNQISGNSGGSDK